MAKDICRYQSLSLKLKDKLKRQKAVKGKQALGLPFWLIRHNTVL